MCNFIVPLSPDKSIKQFMRKKLLSFCALSLVSFATYAGGLLTNTNQHVAYLRNLARQSSTEIDAVYYNPGGTAFFKEGWSLSFNGQSAFQTRTINSTFGKENMFPGFSANIDNQDPKNYTKSFKGDAAAPFLPSLYLAYKRDKWTYSGAISVIGGGGKATFDYGLPSFESIVSLLPVALKGMGVSKYGVDSYINGKQLIFGFQMGAAYQINENWGVFGGVRMNYVSNKYTGYIRNIEANFGGGAKMEKVSSVLSPIAADLFKQANDLKEAGKTEEALAVTKKANEVGTLAALSEDKYLNATQTGWGVTPIVGVHYKNGKWDASMKFEMRTKLNIENKTKRDDTKMFKDGVNTPNDLPSILTFGATYHILPSLRASVGYNHYFDKGAKMANGKQKHIKQGTNEYLGGLEYDICDWALVSAGLQRTKYGVTGKYQSDMSFSVSSMSYGLGAAFMLAKNVKLNVAYFWTKYDKFNKEDVVNIAGLTPQPLPISYEFTRTNKVFGVGIDFTF